LKKLYSTRVEIQDNGSICLVGGLKHKPQCLWLNEMPKFLKDKVMLLNVVGTGHEVKDLGKKLVNDSYHIGLTLSEWQELATLGNYVLPKLEEIEGWMTKNT